MALFIVAVVETHLFLTERKLLMFQKDVKLKIYFLENHMVAYSLFYALNGFKGATCGKSRVYHITNSYIPLLLR